MISPDLKLKKKTVPCLNNSYNILTQNWKNVCAVHIGTQFLAEISFINHKALHRLKNEISVALKDHQSVEINIFYSKESPRTQLFSKKMFPLFCGHQQIKIKGPFSRTSRSTL